MHELAVGVDGQPAFGVRSDVVDVRVAFCSRGSTACTAGTCDPAAATGPR